MYPAREVARMLGLSPARLRAWVRAGFLSPEQGADGELRFAFQDLVLLRAAKGLVEARIPPLKIKRALTRLKARLPEGRELRDLRISAEGEEIVVRGMAERDLSADTGQLLFDFGTQELARSAAPIALAAAKRDTRPQDAGADDWYERGCDLEEADPAAAREAYRRALELSPSHADAHVNLGRLLHEAGDARAAAAHYSLALETRADDAIALFNLGVALEDLREPEGALQAYARAIDVNPRLADAHFNAARLHEKRGQKAQAIRHLRDYQRLTRA